MAFIREPTDGNVTPNGEIRWENGKYYVWDSSWGLIKTTDNFDIAVHTFQKYVQSLNKSNFGRGWEPNHEL